MPKSRLEAFSDGVFAIAFTLLVLEFHLPSADVSLEQFLSRLWPSFAACSISFLLIGLIWANHHSMFVHIRRVDRNLMFLNTLLLADIAFLPFPTELLARALQHGAELRVAAFFYGLTLLLGGIFFNAVWLYATSRAKLLEPTATPRFIQQTRRRFLFGPFSYAAAVLIALVAPVVAVLCYAGLIIYFWLPPRGESEIF